MGGAKKLGPALEKLEALLRETAPDVAATLARPAAKRPLKKLADAVFDAELPHDLAVWFGWHDGQTGFEGLNPEENWTALSAANALSTWEYLNHPKFDGLRPLRPSLLPLFESGSGNHLMYETRPGKECGALFRYWHDEAKQPKKPLHRDITSWVEAALKERKRWAKKARTPTKLDFRGVKFTKLAKRPTEKALAVAPIGTTYHAFHYLPMCQGPAAFVWAKVTQDAWAQGYSLELADALASLQETIRGPISEWSQSVANVHYEMGDRSLDKLSPKPVPRDILVAQVKVT